MRPTDLRGLSSWRSAGQRRERIERLPPLLLLAIAAAGTVAAAWTFYGPARQVTRGDWPAPLDDVLIHYDFARALAAGHPFEWISGQGYSSGETAPAYALVLAVGYAFGFHGLTLGVWAAIVAASSLVYAVSALRELVHPAPPWVALLGGAMLASCGTLDFVWWSGMEVALFGAVAAAFLLRVKRAREATPLGRAGAQWSLGACGGLLVLIRPEAAVLVPIAAIAVARCAGASSALLACVRVVSPAVAATLAVLLVNHTETGYAASAGALLKLLSSDPFKTDEDRALAFVINIAAFLRTLAHDLGLTHGRFAFLLPGLALVSLVRKATRSLGAVCILGAVTFALLVSWNGAARFQNFRYYMPAVTLLLYGSTLGLATLTRGASALRGLGLLVAGAGICLAARHVPEAARLFARASANIHDQQVEVGRRIARTTSPSAIVLVGDAGAIPYLSERHAIDALGLGGYLHVPFVRAAVLGEAATLELIERLPARQRPDVMALYPNWFPGLTGTFGKQIDQVTIVDNVICGGPTKGIYAADWSAMRNATDGSDEPGLGTVLDEIDVADVVSEEAHGYLSPAPRGGWTVFEVRVDGYGVRRFDAGRIIPRGTEESFTVRGSVPAGGSIAVRMTGDAEVLVHAGTRDGRTFDAGPLRRDRGSVEETRWTLGHTALGHPLEPGDRIRLEATRGELRDYHVWLTSRAAPHP